MKEFYKLLNNYNKVFNASLKLLKELISEIPETKNDDIKKEFEKLKTPITNWQKSFSKLNPDNFEKDGFNEENMNSILDHMENTADHLMKIIDSIVPNTTTISSNKKEPKK